MAPAAATPPRVIGHRGARSTAPENTLAGLRQAVAEGVNWVEFDVKLTADGHPVLIHDETVDRTTNGKGKVAEMSLADLRALDAGGWFGRRFAGEKIPTLDEALELMSGLAMGFNLEIKPCPGREAETAAVALERVRKLWPAFLPVPVISSFQLPSLAAAREAAPELPRGLLAERLPADWKKLAEELGCSFIHPGTRALTREDVAAVKAAGYPLLVWTVNEPARARELVGWGVDSIITDSPAAILAALR